MHNTPILSKGKDELIVFAEAGKYIEREIVSQTLQSELRAPLQLVTYYLNDPGRHKLSIKNKGA